MKNRLCWHTWTVKGKEILPSGLEQLVAAGAIEVSADLRLVKKPCIVTYVCAKCFAEKVKRV